MLVDDYVKYKEFIYSLLKDGIQRVDTYSQNFFDREINEILGDIDYFNEDRPKFNKEEWIQALLNDEGDEAKEIILNLPTEYKKYFNNNKIPEHINISTPNDFERISSLFFKKILNTTHIEVRKRSHDDGIDFYGEYECDDNSISVIDFMKHNMWYVGQVKKYSPNNHIGTAYIRELVGTTELAKKGIWSTNSGYSEIKIKHYSGVIPIFVTSSYYSEGAIKIAKSFNIKLLDDIDLAFWLTIIFEGDYDNYLSELNSIP